MRHALFILTALVILTALALVLVPPSVGRADEKVEADPLVGARDAAVPLDLADLLDTALRHNPDIVVAEAQLREAQARLNQTRLEVARRIAHLHLERQRLTEAKRGLGERATNAQAGFAASVRSEEEVREALLAYGEAAAELAQTEAEIRYVLGLGGTAPAAPAVAAEEPAPASGGSRPSFTYAMNEQLEKTVEVHWDSANLDTVLELVHQATRGGLVFVVDPRLEYASWRFTIDLPAPVSVEAALLALCDYQVDMLCFVFRPYGVFVTDPDRASALDAPTLPADLGH